MAKVKAPHGCYYRAINVLLLWNNTVYLANDLRNIIKEISCMYGGKYNDEDKYEYQKANCCPFACSVTKPRWHDEYNWAILNGDGNNFVSVLGDR